MTESSNGLPVPTVEPAASTQAVSQGVSFPSAQQAEALSALEAIAAALRGRILRADERPWTDERLEQAVHRASLLSLVGSGLSVVNAHLRPTPLFSLSYDPDAHTVSFKDLGGFAPVPEEGALEVSLVDLLLAGMLLPKSPLLLEGITGTGKTESIETLDRTILPVENHHPLRLSATNTNVQQPFTEPYVEHGSPRLRLKRSALERIAVLFIDEKNRADSNQVLQLQDGEIKLSSGERGIIGVPAPRLLAGRWVLDREARRPLIVQSAQNPSTAKAVQYTSTRGTDAAIKDRDLEVGVPNMASQVGGTLHLVHRQDPLHEQYRGLFKASLEKSLEVNLDGIGDMAVWFALATSPDHTPRQTLRSSTELIRMYTMLLSKDLSAVFDHDRVVADSWHAALRDYGIDFLYDSTMIPSASILDQLKGVVQGFAEEFVPRDEGKAKKMADALSLIRSVKSSLDAPDPFKAFCREKPYITVADVAAGFAITVLDKQLKRDVKSLGIINQILAGYTQLVSKAATAVRYKIEGIASRFDAHDPTYSMYGLALSQGVSAMVNGPASQEAGSSLCPRLIGGIGGYVAELRRLEEDELHKPMVARFIADLATFAGFVHHYKGELDPLFLRVGVDQGAPDGSGKATLRDGSPAPGDSQPGRVKDPRLRKEYYQVLRDFYAMKRMSPTFPSIFHHRLPAVMAM